MKANTLPTETLLEDGGGICSQNEIIWPFHGEFSGVNIQRKAAWKHHHVSIQSGNHFEGGRFPQKPSEFCSDFSPPFDPPQEKRHLKIFQWVIKPQRHGKKSICSIN